MKLNPPETAPKDGTVILYFFEGSKEGLPAIWDGKCLDFGCWVSAFGRGDGVTWGEFEIHYRDDEDMFGWLPMPQIDDEGNVI